MNDQYRRQHLGRQLQVFGSNEPMIGKDTRPVRSLGKQGRIGLGTQAVAGGKVGNELPGKFQAALRVGYDEASARAAA